MACECLPAIAGISDGPSIDCPIHGVRTHNLTAVAGKPTSGRYVYRAQSLNGWFWQDDMCGGEGERVYLDQHTAFQAALDHAKTCEHQNFNRR